MEENIIDSWIRIQSFKHDSSLHRTWESAMVLECTEEYILVASKKTRVIEADGRVWNTKEPAISIFFFHEWFNVIAMIRQEDICYYCNIASPSLIDKHIIKYIDYDLDLKLLPNGEILFLDEREYEYHKSKYHYSDALDQICRHVFQKVNSMMKKKIFPFEKEKIMEYVRIFEKKSQHEN